jgi:hypothetical protein
MDDESFGEGKASSRSGATDFGFYILVAVFCDIFGWLSYAQNHFKDRKGQ